MLSTDRIDAGDLRKTFRGPQEERVEAVRGIDISIGRGETVALLGPNGAGKSTTIDMLLGLTPPDSGEVSIFGLEPGDAVAAGRVGGMLQTGGLVTDLTVRELVSMAAALYPHPLDVDETLALTGLAPLAGRRTQKLSGGETQRVRFAIALVADPELLVLDEPTVALDVEGRRSFWQTMREFASHGRTILFATHYIEEADDFADRAILMAHGEVVADAPTNEIKAMVGTRQIRAIVPGVGLEDLERLEGVSRAELHGATAILVCSDSDAAIKALLAGHRDARDIEITGAGLEDAFVELTAERAAA